MWLFVDKSENKKTGDIPVTISSRRNCPPSCSFKSSGCYAEQFPLVLHWQRVTDGKIGLTWAAFKKKIRSLAPDTLWRHNVAGDLPGVGDRLSFKMLDELVEANRGKRGFTYTHKPITSARGRAAIKRANAHGFTINLSADGLQDADALADLDIGPVAATIPMDVMKNTVTPKGRKVVICPAMTMDNVTCKSCKLCSISNRTAIIGFPAHGNWRRTVSEMVAK